MFDSITARAHIEWNVNGVCGCPSTLRRRPREGGDPYAVSRRCGTVSVQLKHPGLWVPAFAGTTATSALPAITKRPEIGEGHAPVPPHRPADGCKCCRAAAARVCGSRPILSEPATAHR